MNGYQYTNSNHSSIGTNAQHLTSPPGSPIKEYERKQNVLYGTIYKKFPYQPTPEKEEKYYDFLSANEISEIGSLSLLEKIYKFPISFIDKGWFLLYFRC